MIPRWISLWGLAVAAHSLLASPREQWCQFRGPDGQGRSSAPTLPLTWSETNHVQWKIPIHGRAWSSPVAWDDQIWLTTATEDGRQLFAICVDARTGKILHDRLLFQVEKPQFAHAFNTYASPTPVIEPGRVYLTFGSPGTACLDTRTGEVVWERRDFVCNHFRGAGSSPILFENLLVMNFDGSDQQYVVALNKQTGQTVWKTDRSIDFEDLGPDGQPTGEGDFRKAFSTPQIVQVQSRPLLLSLGAKAAYAYEPLTGMEIWRLEERSTHSASTRPALAGSLVIYPSGFAQGRLLAVRPDGRGDVTESHVAWRGRRNVPCKPSVQIVGDLLFMIDDGGIASCLETQTGQEVWRERVGGNYSASPLSGAGRIYFFSEEGKTTVVSADRTFKILAQNQLEDGFMASPAVVAQALILRTKTHLYRIEAFLNTAVP